MQGFHPEYRALSDGSKTTFEAEAQHRLNPYGPARPPTGQEPPTRWQRIKRFWSRLRALLPLGQK